MKTGNNSSFERPAMTNENSGGILDGLSLYPETNGQTGLTTQPNGIHYRGIFLNGPITISSSQVLRCISSKPIVIHTYRQGR